MKILKKEIGAVDLLSLHEFSPDKYPFLLESVAHNKENRFSILFSHPEDSIVCNTTDDVDFLKSIDSRINMADESDLPFCGGWFIFLSYEVLGILEPSVKTFDLDFPLAYAVKISSAVITDNLSGKTFIVNEKNDDSIINSIEADISSMNIFSGTSMKPDFQMIPEDGDDYIKGVEISKKYIVAGDVFQVNLSREWKSSKDSNLSSSELYHKLKISNPSPFSALAKFNGFDIISSSPERLFSLKDDVIETRPIAGTHPRGDTEKEDIEIKDRLINNPKEIAEHTMILDLERNDMGRVCEYGSIRVNEIMILETYKYVHHIVSNIIGRIAADTTFSSIIRGIFPGGTITGCPKVRCMEIINEIETGGRGSYTGSLGYISNNGKMDFNILIRTITNNKGAITFRAGAGIVYDSVAESELMETEHKAKGMIKAFT
jgi:anthranilate synthase component 1